MRPKNLDKNFKQRRQQMVMEQLVVRGITNKCVLRAMEQVPREKFVEKELQDEAYADYPLPIGFGQTISQPYMVAKICELAGLSKTAAVLDIGTGSGYQAAVISQCAKWVVTIERIPALARMAAARLRKLGLDNVEVICGDGYRGAARRGQFRAIVAAATVEVIPPAWKQQLRAGGRIVTPMYTPEGQRLILWQKEPTGFRRRDCGAVAFVPLIRQS